MRHGLGKSLKGLEKSYGRPQCVSRVDCGSVAAARSFHKPLDEFSHTRMVGGKKGFRGEFHPLQKCDLSDAVHEWRPKQRFNAFRKNSIDFEKTALRGAMDRSGESAKRVISGDIQSFHTVRGSQVFGPLTVPC